MPREGELAGPSGAEDPVALTQLLVGCGLAYISGKNSRNPLEQS